MIVRREVDSSLQRSEVDDEGGFLDRELHRATPSMFLPDTGRFLGLRVSLLLGGGRRGLVGPERGLLDRRARRIKVLPVDGSPVPGRIGVRITLH